MALWWGRLNNTKINRLYLQFANRKSQTALIMKHKGMRPQDILVLLKISITKGRLYQKQIAQDLLISPSEVSESLTRSTYSGLIGAKSHNVKVKTFYEFIIYGLPYVFPAIQGSIVKGIPTASSMSPLNSIFTNEIEYVWPSKNATHTGISIEPLYPSVPEAAQNDIKLYEALTLVDAVRIGYTREKKEASQLLKQLLK